MTSKEDEEKEEQKGEMQFFENDFSLNFFKLSGLVTVHTASLLTQEHSKSILEKFCVKGGI